MIRLRVVVVAWVMLTAGVAQAGDGFALDRYEPTAAGEWTFWVDHPWYTRNLKQPAAVGLTLDYGHDPLVFGTRMGSKFTQTAEIVAHQLVGHIDAAFSFIDRLNISLSLPIVFYEGGSAQAGIKPESGTVGDPRIGVMARLWKQPYLDVVSLHAGAFLWIPVGQSKENAGDSSVRFMLKLVAAGLGARHILWSATFAYLYRADASLGNLAAMRGNSVGQELQLAVAAAWADFGRRFTVGPEAVLATTVSSSNAFRKDFTSLELLLGAQYNVKSLVQLGVAVGLGTLREPGTPDARVIFRVAYAPMRVAQRPVTPPPPPDRDHDGVIDVEDSCPDEHKGPRPDPNKPGCPLRDRDGDGVYDDVDLCPDEPAGAHPDPKRAGCPDKDSDNDGVYDAVDLCPREPAGTAPDPMRPGCPAPDRDHDKIPDDVDACPDKPGAPSPNPKRNGCPGLVEIRNGRIAILKPVYFATNKDVILAKSFPVLQAVADALAVTPTIKKLVVEGHTDNQGAADKNLDLSQRRAASVRRWLIEHGIEGERLDSQGYGLTQPIMTNRTVVGRAANRRVEFRITDPPAPPETQAP